MAFFQPEIFFGILTNAVLVGLIYAVIAAGLSLIFGLMEIVNFAHGELFMWAMYSSFWLFTLLSVDPLFSIPINILALGIFGVLVYLGIIRRALRGPMLAQMVATFGLATFLRGLAQKWFSPDFRLIPHPLVEGRIEMFGVALGRPQVVAGIGALLAFFLLWFLITRTEMGLSLQATSQDKQAAALMGIDTERMYALGWALGLGCLGVAGALMANYYYVFPMVGLLFGNISYIAVALGGFGSIPGALVAGIILSLVEHIAGWFVPPFKYAAVYLIYIIIVVVRPQGLFGRS
jgi:branched-chain amino acid transport system permease protein